MGGGGHHAPLAASDFPLWQKLRWRTCSITSATPGCGADPGWECCQALQHRDVHEGPQNSAWSRHVGPWSSREAKWVQPTAVSPVRQQWCRASCVSPRPAAAAAASCLGGNSQLWLHPDKNSKELQVFFKALKYIQEKSQVGSGQNWSFSW